MGKSKKSRLEPLKIQNSIDGHPNKANDVDLADDKGDIMQKKEILHHLVDHQQHQEGKSLEECNISVTVTNTTTAADTTATATSDDNSLMKREISLDKESIKKMDYGHLKRGTCSSPNDACVPQNKAIEENGAFFEPEDASYAFSGYCVPLSAQEDMKYKNGATTTMSLIDREEFNKGEEMTDSYYHNHPQYDHHHRQLDSSLNCTSFCSDTRLDVSAFVNDDESFKDLIYQCTEEDGDCPSEYDEISCWNTAGITNMSYAFEDNSFNAPLECWNVGQVTSMLGVFNGATYFDQPIDSWDVSQVEDMDKMFSGAASFNEPIDSWNVSQVKDMYDMFFEADSFNQPVDSWDVSQVEDMDAMFADAGSFNQSIDSWDVSQVKDMGDMFNRATSFNQPIGSWDVSQVKDMSDMFKRATYFNQSIGSWDVSQVKDMGD